MNYCIIELKSQTATFRIAEFQNFHKTLPLPPPTTLIGLGGAALGLSPKMSQEFFYENKFLLGVCGKSNGIAKDLWKYNDFENGSIIFREILIGNHFYCAFGCADDEKVTQIGEAFNNPKFALTLGSSDSLAKVQRIVYKENTSESNNLKNCIIEGNIVTEVLEKALENPVFSIHTSSEPTALDIPVKFEYDGNYGMRSVSKRKILSIISTPMELNVKKEGLMHEGSFIPLINL